MNNKISIFFIVRSQIAAPSKPITLHINVTTVNISWTFSDRLTDTPTHFIVQIRSQTYNDTDFHNLTTPIHELYFIYSGLIYGEFYQFRIIAISDGNHSEPSEASSIFDNGLTGNPMYMYYFYTVTVSFILS